MRFGRGAPTYLKDMPGAHISLPKHSRISRELLAAHLKLCPLCNHLVALECDECTFCAWRGQFVHDEFAIEAAFERLVVECPELVEAIGISLAPRRHFFEVALGWIRGFFRGIDLRA